MYLLSSSLGFKSQEKASRMHPSYIASSCTSRSRRLLRRDSTSSDPRRMILYRTSSTCISSSITRFTISFRFGLPQYSSDVCRASIPAAEASPPPAMAPAPAPFSPPSPLLAAFPPSCCVWLGSLYCAMAGSRSFSSRSCTTWIQRPSPKTWGDLSGFVCSSSMMSMALITMMSSAVPANTPQMIGFSSMFSKMVLLNLLNLLEVDSSAKDLIQARSIVFCRFKLIFCATSSRSSSFWPFFPNSASLRFFARSIRRLSRLSTCRWWHTLQKVCTVSDPPPPFFASAPLPCTRSVKPAKFFHRWHCVHHFRNTRPFFVSRQSRCRMRRSFTLRSRLNPRTVHRLFSSQASRLPGPLPSTWSLHRPVYL
mmetsp:Transcript_19138/g.40069  ORF Transcript_19138/g.40069 Transcript_19138/m.40069 type:complete len:367 (-) Transcript_19138:789-1889(-)